MSPAISDQLHSINIEQRLYVLPCENGFSCLGFDAAERRRKAYAKWAGLPEVDVAPGTLGAFEAYLTAQRAVLAKCKAEGKRCPAQLTPEFIGIEGKRVEVTYPDGEKRRFYVGKSTGMIPVHLEISKRNSSGGGAVYFPAGATFRVIGQR